MGANTPSLAMRTKLALVLVSRDWRRVSQKILYQHLVIRSPFRANIILETLQSSQSGSTSEVEQPSMHGYGQHVRHIETFTFTRGSNDIKYLQVIFRILQLCPNLRMLSGRWIHPLPVEFLNGLAALLGPRLSELYWSERQFSDDQSTNTNIKFLSSFQSLRVLDLRHFVGINPLSWPEQGPDLTLPLVQSLTLSLNPRSLGAATKFRLPSLRNLTLLNSVPEDDTHDSLKSFLKAHGKSLVTIDLPTPSVDSEPDPDHALLRRTIPHINPDIFLAGDVCPNLETLVFSVSCPAMQPYTHNNLRRIGLRGLHVDGLYPEKPSLTKDHLLTFNVSRFPQLQLIQTVGFLVEASSDSLAKDLFIWWVERFESMDVLLVDGEGVMWAYHPETAHEVTSAAERVHTTSSMTLLKQSHDSEQLKAEVGHDKHFKDKESVINIELST